MNRLSRKRSISVMPSLAEANLRRVVKLEERGSLFGAGHYILRGPNGAIKRQGGLLVPNFKNLITDVGDEVWAKRLAAVSVNLPTGMRLGTGSTAVSKNGAGAAIVTYLSGSNRDFDATYPTAASKGAGLGWRVTFRTTWPAGVATANGISEVVITNETPHTNVAGTAANTLSRALLSPVVNKGASDSLEVTWYYDDLGA